MTTSNKSDSLQPPKGGGFSPTLLMKELSMQEYVALVKKLEKINAPIIRFSCFGCGSNPLQKAMPTNTSCTSFYVSYKAIV